ncbi:hypothetical protein [Rhodococcus triatomae]|nr:hypothetical protein G419_25237 [Rhodococcus triatomae BKS 15-14]
MNDGVVDLRVGSETLGNFVITTLFADEDGPEAVKSMIDEILAHLSETIWCRYEEFQRAEGEDAA